MNPTPELRERLRRLLDERIPPGGSDADTRFPDAELDEILAEAANLYLAAAEGWRRKAAMVARELGPVASSRAGDADVEVVGLEEAQQYCLRMAAEYERLGQAQAAPRSRAMALEPPDVLGTASNPAGCDPWRA